MALAEMSPLDAYSQVMSFASRRGELALRLALHAAVPQVLRPELLHLLRLNFVPEAVNDLAIEADVLFASFCEDLGNGYYRLDPNARSNLLTHLDPTYGDARQLRSRHVAGFLVKYIGEQMQAVTSAGDSLYSGYLELEYWNALAFLDPDAAAEQLAMAVQAASDSAPVAVRIRIAGLASTLATPLVQHQRLLAYAAGVDALQAGATEQAQKLFESLDDSELKVGVVTLRSPRALLRSNAARPVSSELTIEHESQLQVEEPKPVEASGPRVFISYSHEDRGWFDRIRVHLESYVQTGQFRVWHDREIGAGEPWQSQLHTAIKHSRVALVLISPRYLASDYLMREELARIIERAKAAELRLFWVPVSVSLWEKTPLLAFQAVGDPSAPLDYLKEPECERRLAEIARDIGRYLRPSDYQSPPELSEPVMDGMFLLFVGHTVDLPDRVVPRFPADLEPSARAAIRRAVLEESSRRTGTLGIASGSPGADILFHEVCAELGIETELFLPFPEANFIAQVVAPAGPEWVERFRRIVTGSKAVNIAWTSAPPDSAAAVTAWRRNAEAMMGTGLARGAHGAALIALWDGTPTESPGGPTELLARAHTAGVRVTVLDPRSLSAEAANRAAADEPSGETLRQLGIESAKVGRMEEAVHYFEQALAAALQVQNRGDEGAALNELGTVHIQLGLVQKAIEFFDRALAVARETGDLSGECLTCGHLGIAYARMNHLEKALTFHRQSLDLAQKLEDRSAEAYALGNLGEIHIQRSELEIAIAHHERALTILRELNDRRGEGYALGRLGNAYDLLGQPEKAIACYEQCLPIARETADRGVEGSSLGSLGAAYLQLHQAEKAIAFSEQSLHIMRELGDLRGERRAFATLGVAYAELGQSRKALEHVENAVRLSHRIGDANLVNEATANLERIRDSFPGSKR